jgi:hypothetical protein
MKLLSIIKDFFGPAAELIDNVHTSTEEKLEKKAQLLALQASFLEAALEHEAKALERKSEIVLAEARGESWLQRSWRPVTMLVFLGLVVFDQFGWLQFRLASEAWTLLQLGIGGYVVGRSVEKTVVPIANVLKSKEKT